MKPPNWKVTPTAEPISDEEDERLRDCAKATETNAEANNKLRSAFRKRGTKWVNAMLKEDDVDTQMTCPFTHTDYVDLFDTETYLAHVGIGTKSSELHNQVATVDTAAGPNLIDKSLVDPAHLKRLTKPAKLPRYAGAEGSPLEMLGVLPLIVKLGDLRRVVWFGVLEKLSAALILGTSYLNRFIRMIEPLRQTIRPINSRAVPLLVDPDDDPVVSAINEPKLLGTHDDALPTDDLDYFGNIRLAKSIKIPARTQVWAKVKTEATGMVPVTPHWRTQEPYHVSCANGVANVWRNKPFYILLANFDTTPVWLPKQMRVAVASNPPVATREGPEREPQTKTPSPPHSPERQFASTKRPSGPPKRLTRCGQYEVEIATPHPHGTTAG